MQKKEIKSMIENFALKCSLERDFFIGPNGLDADPVDLPTRFSIVVHLPMDDSEVAHLTGYILEREELWEAADACGEEECIIAGEICNKRTMELMAKYSNRLGKRACFLSSLEYSDKDAVTMVLANLRAVLNKLAPDLCGIYGRLDPEEHDEWLSICEKAGFKPVGTSLVIWMPVDETN